MKENVRKRSRISKIGTKEERTKRREWRSNDSMQREWKAHAKRDGARTRERKRKRKEPVLLASWRSRAATRNSFRRFGSRYLYITYGSRATWLVLRYLCIVAAPRDTCYSIFIDSARSIRLYANFRSCMLSREIIDRIMGSLTILSETCFSCLSANRKNYSCNVEEIFTDENDVVRIRSSFSRTILLFVRSLVFVAFPLVLIRWVFESKIGYAVELHGNYNPGQQRTRRSVPVRNKNDQNRNEKSNLWMDGNMRVRRRVNCTCLSVNLSIRLHTSPCTNVQV